MIHWKYIKGLNQAQAAESPEIYSYIAFSESNETGSEAPEFYISDVNSFSEATSLGKFLLTNAEYQKIYKKLYFYTTSGLSFIGEDNAETWKKSEFYSEYIGGKNTLNLDVLDNYAISMSRYESNTRNFIYKLFFDAEKSSISFIDKDNKKPFEIIRDEESYKANFQNAKLYAEKSILTNGECKASYFNATSDRRAKTDIKILDFNALDLIKKVQLYSFTYKDLGTKSIGIIAQDVQSVSLDGFKLVDHEDASGKDMDYMTVHESKLVYILWKAIQEQQKEIEDLKQELKKRG